MNIKLILKGFVVGIGKVIPGVSGSMLAMTLGIYEEIIDAITNFFGDKKKHTKLLINFGIGLFLAIVLFSKLLLFLLKNYYAITMSLFLGLILGTIFRFSKKLKFHKKNIIIFLLFFSIILFLSFFQTKSIYVFKPTIGHYLYTIFLGFLDALSSIVPGISGTALLMMLGSYQFVLSILASPFSFLFIIYGIGIVIGIIIISYLMKYLLDNYKDEAYSAIMALSVSSILILILDIISLINIKTIFLLFVGIIVGTLFDK